jgi:hypothetical protein
VARSPGNVENHMDTQFVEALGRLPAALAKQR